MTHLLHSLEARSKKRCQFQSQHAGSVEMMRCQCGKRRVPPSIQESRRIDMSLLLKYSQLGGLARGTCCIGAFVYHAHARKCRHRQRQFSRITLIPCNFVFIRFGYVSIFHSCSCPRQTFLTTKRKKAGTSVFNRTLVLFPRVLWTGTSRSPSPMPSSTSHRHQRNRTGVYISRVSEGDLSCSGKFWRDADDM